MNAFHRIIKQHKRMKYGKKEWKIERNNKKKPTGKRHGLLRLWRAKMVQLIKSIEKHKAGGISDTRTLLIEWFKAFWWLLFTEL